jgi:hypothetical protein
MFSKDCSRRHKNVGTVRIILSSCVYNKNVDIWFSAHDAILEWASSDTLKVDKDLKTVWEQESQRGLQEYSISVKAESASGRRNLGTVNSNEKYSKKPCRCLSIVYSADNTLGNYLSTSNVIVSVIVIKL